MSADSRNSNVRLVYRLVPIIPNPSELKGSGLNSDSGKDDLGISPNP